MSRLSTAVQAGEQRRRPRPQPPARLGGSPRGISINIGTPPVWGPGLPTWKRGTLSSERFRTWTRSCAHRLPRRICGGVGGAFPPLGQELSPEPPARRCELSLRAGYSGVCGVMAQTGIIISSGYRRGRGGPERRDQRPRRSRSPCAGPKSCAFSPRLPCSCYPLGLRIAGGLRSPMAPTWALGQNFVQPLVSRLKMGTPNMTQEPVQTKGQSL